MPKPLDEHGRLKAHVDLMDKANEAAIQAKEYWIKGRPLRPGPHSRKLKS